jgi:hypothetical protein
MRAVNQLRISTGDALLLDEAGLKWQSLDALPKGVTCIRAQAWSHWLVYVRLFFEESNSVKELIFLPDNSSDDVRRELRRYFLNEPKIKV